MDAEHAGEDGGGQVGGELEQRGGAVPGGLESELAESLGEWVRADRAPGFPAGEQRWRATGVADGGFSVTVRHDREGKRGNGFGQHDGLVAETDKDLPAAGAGVVDRQPADCGRPLGVKQHEQAGEAVFGFDRFVVEQPPGLSVDDAGGTVPSDGWRVEGGEFLLLGPSQEVLGFPPQYGVVAGGPFVEVALACVRERKALCGHPIEESDRGSYVLPDEDVLVAGGVGASCTFSQAPQHVPKGVPAQQVLFIWVCSLGDGGVDPLFESHHSKPPPLMPRRTLPSASSPDGADERKSRCVNDGPAADFAPGGSMANASTAIRR